MSKNYSAFWQYPNSILYEDLAFGSHIERVAAMVKYRDNLPDEMLVLEFSDTWVSEATEQYLALLTKYI